MDEKEDKVMQLLDDLKEKYGEFLDDTASEAGDGSGLHFDLTSGQIINGDEIYIEAFYLKPEAQGKGIGKKMVNALKKLSDEIDVPITLLDKTLETPYGTSFWKSMGFDIDDDTATALYNYEGDPSSTRFARESLQLAPDDPSELFKDPASENMTGAMESLSAALPEDLSDVDLSDEDKQMIENFRKDKKEFEAITNPVNSLEDDVAEVNNDFVYNKFNEKQRTADNVIFRELEDGTVELLTIQRKRGPHRSLFALPGGIVEGETNLDQLIQGIVDPGKPVFRETEVHEFLMPFTNTVLDLTDSPKFRANEVFGAEALREAVEEVSLNRDVIKKSFYLPIKYDRYDWDARAAAGVDVGGVGIIVDNEWTPKAKDDAVSYEWIKLDDVISGEKQLAFGHVEFVEDALKISLSKNLLEKSNQETIYRNEMTYDYNDLAQLKERVAEAKRRNTEIILESNKVRIANGQPEIPISGNNIVDRQNKALIDSIRGISSYSPYLDGSGNVKPFTAQMQMSPDYIFVDIMQYTTQEAATGLMFSENEIATMVDEAPMFADDPDLMYKKITLRPEAINKAKIQIRENVLKNYRSQLKSKINDGMQIAPFIAAMYDNASTIVNSNEFNVFLTDLLNEGLKSYPEGEFAGADQTYYVEAFEDSEVREYGGLHEGNTIIQRDGMETAVEQNIQYLIDSDYKSGPALLKIREANNKFFKNIFPEEIYLPSWEYWKTNKAEMPQALLDSKQAKLGADGRLKGIVYHGSPGLNARGRAVLEILEKHVPRVKEDKRKLFADILNKINYKTDLNWLDPSKYRGQMLRLNYMYTTSNPFVASSYSMGGHNSNIVNVLNVDANDKFISILNSDDVKNNPDVINKIDKDLKKLGMALNIPEGERAGSIQIKGLNELENKKLFVDPAISQIEFDVPGDAILHTDMPIVRQINNPKVKNLIDNIIKNVDPNNIFDEEVMDRLVYNLYDNMKRSMFDNLSDSDQNRLFVIIKDAIENSNSVHRETIKQFYLDNLKYSQNNVRAKIEEGIKSGTANFSDFQYYVRDNLNAQESITDKKFKEALEYVNEVTGTNPQADYFYDRRITAGDIVFNKLLNDQYPSQRIDYESVLLFANELPVESLGGSYSATNDLLFIKYFFENMEYDSPFYNDAINYASTNQLDSDRVVKTSQKLNQDGSKFYVPENDPYLHNLAESLRRYFKQHKERIRSKFGEDVNDFINLDLNNDVRLIQDSLLPEFEGDKTLINFLRQANGMPKRYVQPTGNSYAAADILLLKSLSQSGIEVVAGTGGGRVGNDFHDVFGIVDPGDKFGTGVPREAKYIIKPVEMDADKIEIINDLTSGTKGFADLDDESIRAIAELIPIDVLMKNETLSEETKQRYSKLYNDLNIADTRFFDPKYIQPSAVDGAMLQQFDAVRQLIAQQSIFGDVDDQTVQKHVADLFNQIDGQVAPEEKINFMKSSGILKTLADGLDMFDVAVLGPVLIDVLMSKTTGVGSSTETIGGAIADVAEDIYDPTEEDTVFEKMYGSPESPGTLAGAVSESLEIGTEAYVNPLLEAAQSNNIIMSMFDSLKEGAVSALNTVKDGFGLNDWLYDVKRDMYVTSKLKEKGYNRGKTIDPKIVKEIENEYESAIPKTVDKYGRLLDDSDTSNFPSYSPGRR